jgi:hypothetical protein
MFICIFPVSAVAEKESPDNIDTVAIKKDLAAKHASEYKIMSENEKQDHIKKVDRKLLELSAGDFSQEYIDKEMNKLRVYRLDIPQEENNNSITPMVSFPNDIEFSTPRIYYDAATDNWVVVSGGWWKNDEWIGDGPDYRGKDAFSISIIPDHGVTYEATMIHTEGYLSDGQYWNMSMDYPIPCDYQYGVIYKYDDPAVSYWHNADYYTGYSWKHFSSLLRYTNEFSSYHGRVTTHYSHTFKGVEIETISVSESGFSVSFSSSDGDWDAQINYEKRF